MKNGYFYNKFCNQSSSSPSPNQTQSNNILEQYQNIQNGNANIADILFTNKRINQEQYNAIKNMGNNYQQIAQYLIHTGSLNIMSMMRH